MFNGNLLRLFDLSAALWIEIHKAKRSRMPIFTAIGFALIPLVGALFMIILRDPEFARKAGLISTKSQIFGGAADWANYFDFLGQGIAIGGIILFSLISSWVFGREFADQTLKDMLAVPIRRSTLLSAKFIVVAIWSAALSVMLCVLALLVGIAIGLPSSKDGDVVQGVIRLAFTTGLVLVVMTPIAFFASIGRGYMAPMGATIALVAFANIFAVLGWGSYFPWSIPGLFAGMGGAHPGQLELSSTIIVALTALIGVFSTFAWWAIADHER